MSYSPTELPGLTSALAGQYTLEGELGRGGMGIVLLARDEKLDRLVALKVLPPHLASMAGVRERFLREARTAARLGHPNIVPIHRADELGGHVFFVMALVEGESLAQRLRARGRLAPAEAVPILSDVARALHYAHTRGVVHRDIKPENILLDRESGRAMVTDFGIARLAEAAPLTATGQVLGTVHFMSPEQVSGDAIDGRSDLYSLGVVAFHALSGRLPFDSETASAVLVAHVTRAAPRLLDVARDLPPALARVIDACLAKDPAARWATGEQLARALEDALDAAASGAARTGTPLLSDAEAQAVWQRAAELQALTGQQPVPPAAPVTHGDVSQTSGFRMTEVREAAVEAGIPARYVQRAASDLGLASSPMGDHVPAVPMPAPPPTSSARWFGAPLVVEQEIECPGELSDASNDALVEIIRREVGDVGHVSTVGRLLAWTSSRNDRRLSITVTPRGGRTTIHVSERFGQLAGGLFGGIVGGGGGGVGVPVLAAALAQGGPLAGIAAFAGVVAAAYALARAIFTSVVGRRTTQLRRLADRLTQQVSEDLRLLPPARR